MKALEKLTTQQKNLIILGVAIGITIAVAAGFYFYLYTPKLQEIVVKKEELANKEKELKEIQLLATELAFAQQNKQRLSSQLNKLEKGLKSEEYVPMLLTEIEKLAQETKTKVASIVPTEMAGLPPAMIDTGQGIQVPVEYKEIMLNIPLECTYESLRDFLDKLSKMPVIIVVNDLRLSGGGTIDSFFGTPKMMINLPTTIYILPRGDVAKSNL